MIDELVCGDCLNVLKNIPDKSVDLVVIDPPYQMNCGGGGGAFGRDKRAYHDEIDHMTNGIENAVLEELVRVMKKINIYIWCSKDQLQQFINFFVGKGCKLDLLTYHKTVPTPTCNNKYLSDTEYLLFFKERGVKLYGSYATKKKYYVRPTNKKDKKKYNHPTIKPLDIVENLIINSTKENDLVLDCYLGSGTTAVAAKKLNRRFIGIELDENILNIARERLKEL